MLKSRRYGAIDGHALSANVDLPRARLLESGDQAQRRRLAAAGWPEQREYRSTLDVERDVVDRHDRAEALAHLVQPDIRLARRPPDGVRPPASARRGGPAHSFVPRHGQIAARPRASSSRPTRRTGPVPSTAGPACVPARRRNARSSSPPGGARMDAAPPPFRRASSPRRPECPPDRFARKHARQRRAADRLPRRRRNPAAHRPHVGRARRCRRPRRHCHRIRMPVPVRVRARAVVINSSIAFCTRRKLGESEIR